MEIIRQEDYKTTRWKGGVTRQIFISPADGDLSALRFEVRISSAIIDDVRSDFSDFTGFTRYILPLEGEISLFRNGQRTVLEHDVLYRFEGSEVVSSENTSGAVDFNVIVRHGIAAEVSILQDAVFADNRQTVVFTLDECSLDGRAISKHTTVLFAQPFRLKGKAVVVRLDR